MWDPRINIEQRPQWMNDLEIPLRLKTPPKTSPQRGDVLEKQPEQSPWMNALSHLRAGRETARRNRVPDGERSARMNVPRRILQVASERVVESHPVRQIVPQVFDIWLLELFRQARLVKKFRGRFDLIADEELEESTTGSRHVFRCRSPQPQSSDQQSKARHKRMQKNPKDNRRRWKRAMQDRHDN